MNNKQKLKIKEYNEMYEKEKCKVPVLGSHKKNYNHSLELDNIGINISSSRDFDVITDFKHLKALRKPNLAKTKTVQIENTN